MSAPRWSRLPTSVAEDLGSSRELYDHYRLFFLAMTRNRGDGHAPFGQGEIARELGIDTKNVARVVTRAKALELVQEHSGARCIVLPNGVTHGSRDDAHPWCRWHPPKPDKRERHRQTTAFTPEHHRQTTGSVSKHHRQATAFGDVSAGHGVSPLLLSSSSLEVHPEGVANHARTRR